ncbi:hypothetical protein GALL_357830 [mine drainage metagenome]|jgi:DUF1365 family protein|uniref:DUF1365 domain-containing protein n=1 Tax=mine drainage metagenome TaxID=410659 RepID=A0A1J5QFW5_9ZZZZ
MTAETPQPHIGSGIVRHTRLRPAFNAFAYRVFFVMLPMRALARRPGVVALPRNVRGLIAFCDADHGDGRENSLQWIEELLRAEGIDDVDGEIWLQTFPRVLGYVFNPVSFWYCHRADGGVAAIVAEVNNTFGERHCYLLLPSAGRSTIRWGQELHARKVFHVSPFCRVEGSYRFRFLRRDGAQGEHIVARIDHDDAQGPLLLTSISGELEPLTRAALRRAFFAHPMHSFGVMARIHWQALRLWLKRVPFVSKPVSSNVQVTR